MRFEEAYAGWQAGRLRQEEAARLLGVCERSFRRYIDPYEEAGLEGLIDRRLAQVSGRRAALDEVVVRKYSIRLRRVQASTHDASLPVPFEQAQPHPPPIDGGRLTSVSAQVLCTARRCASVRSRSRMR
jgi:hypothetical protein